jgi:chromosome segregation ATPase
MIPYLLAQAELSLGAIFEAFLVQYGALAALAAIVGFMLFLTWRSQINSETQRTQQDNRRDSLINDYASKYGELSGTVATQGIALAKAEGKVDLLTTQLEAERDKRQKEREELKTAIRDLSDKLKKYENEIAELKESINGKDKHIQGLEGERDKLMLQLAERDLKILAIEKELAELRESKRHLEGVVMEQSTQIVSLTKQIVELEDSMKALNPKPDSATVAHSAVIPAPEKTQPLDESKLSTLEEKENKE